MHLRPDKSVNWENTVQVNRKGWVTLPLWQNCITFYQKLLRKKFFHHIFLIIIVGTTSWLDFYFNFFFFFYCSNHCTFYIKKKFSNNISTAGKYISLCNSMQQNVLLTKTFGIYDVPIPNNLQLFTLDYFMML